MKITIFTSNQPRHIALVKEMAKVAEDVYVIQECKTVLPGYIQDFYSASPAMEKYFSYVMGAEKKVFGELEFLPDKCHIMGLRCGDLSSLPIDILQEALNSDYYIVFGASFIKGKLIDFLVKHNALNIHMGVSPFFRGCSCNFWAIYDGHPEMVGATIHILSKGLDSGDMLCHAFPGMLTEDPFELGMLAVKAAFQALTDMIVSGKIENVTPVSQDKSLEIRYAKNDDFTDEIVNQYLSALPSGEELNQKIAKRDLTKFVNPYIMEKK